MAEAVEQDNDDTHLEEQHMVDDGDKCGKGELLKRKNKKKRSRKDSSDADRRGVCYLSRVPPHMNPSHIRLILSKFGDVQRIYLVPEDRSAQVHHKQAGGFRGKEFSEGWVEFTKKSVAKRVANLLNGEQIGGRKRSSFYYDIWNIKYLSKFKWDDLISEIAERNHIREEKLNLEISAAKRERDFYLSKVEKSIALKHMQERRKKKQKTGEESDKALEPKVIRRVPQNRPVSDSGKSKPKLSKNILAGVFSSS
ncbi:Pre-rRNA-processing protein ESF2 [Ananas comosus]|uniref:Pre-rRNA-processing protein ESF2 n=1 Tax=Ananas comosus TaxID=4615 RepID=A0A199UZ78_ANACO|nr:Pre-rRNA-processing protein ESF2 [Ananas comosus]